MKIKVLKRNPEDYVRESKHDIHKLNRNYRCLSVLTIFNLTLIPLIVLWNTPSRQIENTNER